MIHCIFSAIEIALEKGNALPDIIYIQIDGGSENIAKTVYAAIEHLVFKKLCKEIIVTRLPVGHTHEDIDSRFGKVYIITVLIIFLLLFLLCFNISLFISLLLIVFFIFSFLLVQVWNHFNTISIYTIEAFEEAVLAAFGNDPKVSIVRVGAVYDYSPYYEQYLDNISNYAKLEDTMHQIRIQRNDNKESIDNVTITNYKKYSQDIVCDLRINSSFEDSNIDQLDLEHSWCTYWPIIVLSNYLPAEAIESQRRLGMSFLASVPKHSPKPKQCEEWSAHFLTFMEKMLNRFKLPSEQPIIKKWNEFFEDNLPYTIDVNTNKKYPSDNINDFLNNGGIIDAPLHSILYNDNYDFELYATQNNLLISLPPVISSLVVSSSSPSTRTTGFSGANSHIASIFDTRLMEVISHTTCSVLCNSNPIRQRIWLFNHKYMLNGVIMEKGLGARKTYRLGVVVAFCKHDAVEGDLYQVENKR